MSKENNPAQVGYRSASIRDIRSNNIHAQRKFEDNFSKPMAARNQNELDMLYFKGGN
jgi:hypothetical protein